MSNRYWGNSEIKSGVVWVLIYIMPDCWHWSIKMISNSIVPHCLVDLGWQNILTQYVLYILLTRHPFPLLKAANYSNYSQYFHRSKCHFMHYLQNRKLKDHVIWLLIESYAWGIYPLLSWENSNIQMSLKKPIAKNWKPTKFSWMFTHIALSTMSTISKFHQILLLVNLITRKLFKE